MLTSELVAVMKPHLEGWTVEDMVAEGDAVVFRLRRIDPKTEEVKTRVVKIVAIQSVRLQGRSVGAEAALHMVVGDAA